MWFHFCTANHNPVGRCTLLDMYKWFEAGLLDLGHKVTFSDNLVEPSAINIFWEYFDEKSAQNIIEIGITYGIVATEIPDGNAFNWRPEPEWKLRFDSFQKVAKGSSFIWTMVESTTAYYNNISPSGFMELGFSERLIPKYSQNQQSVDFSFYGLRTPYREKIVSELRKYSEVIWPEKFLSESETRELIATTKVGLNFKQSEQWPIASPTRLGRFLMAKRDLASEFVPVSTRQGDILGLCDEHQDFVEFCFNRLESDFSTRASTAYEKYQNEMSMADIMESIIEKTCSNIKITNNSKVSLEIQQTVEPPKLIESVGYWNIVLYKGKYYGIAQRIGDVDVSEGLEVLVKRYGGHLIFCDEAIEPIRRLIKQNDLFLNNSNSNCS